MFDIIKDLLINNYQVDPILVAEDSRVSELGLDSLGFVELLFDVEDKIGKKIPESLIKPEHVDLTLGELCTLLQTL